jgi:transcriptional regulator with XRE-family HTH domain
MSVDPYGIGQRIAQARKEQGLTQAELARLLGVSTRSVQSYEGGTIVPYRHVRRIAAVTGRPSAWLLDGRENRGAALQEGLTAVNRELAERLRVQEELLVSLRGELNQLRALRSEVDRLRGELRAVRRPRAFPGEEPTGGGSGASSQDVEEEDDPDRVRGVG